MFYRPPVVDSFVVLPSEKSLLLKIGIGRSWNPRDLRFPWLRIRELFFLEVFRVFPRPGGPFGGVGRFFKGIGGIEEEDKVGCADMIFENYEH